MSADKVFIEGDWRARCVEALAQDGYTVYGPVHDGETSRFAECKTGADLATDLINTRNPAKEVFFPATETLLDLSFSKTEGHDFAVAPKNQKRIALLGCRPCDASSFDVLDRVFNWDYKDAFYNARREGSLILTVGCSTADAHCFCTTVGLAPDATEGSDLLLQAVDSGALVTVVSEEGKAFVEAHRDLFVAVPELVNPKVATVTTKFDVAVVKPWLDAHFEDDYWEEVALKCMGCGACSFLCPTCHCFDIVDEAHWQRGERRRNYDYCAAELFTQHTSGHNPRATQLSRCRNRVLHKFKYFVERFGRRACVGCGRCTRVCGAGQSLPDILHHIAGLASGTTAGKETP